MFDAVRNDERYCIYSFNIPSVEYCNTMKEHLLLKKKEFDEVLEKEGFIVEIRHLLHSKKDGVKMKDGPPKL